MKYIKYDPKNLASFDEEWMPHAYSNDWWTVGGILYDEKENIYSYGLVFMSLFMKTYILRIGIMTFTDHSKGKHYLRQIPSIVEGSLEVSSSSAVFSGIGSILRRPEGFSIKARQTGISFDLNIENGKGPIRSGHDGIMNIGSGEMHDSIFSFTLQDMPTVGIANLDGREVNLTGRSFLKRQGGEYNLMHRVNNYESMILNFYSGDQMYVQIYPRINTTYATLYRNGETFLFEDFMVEPMSHVILDGMEYSDKWKFTLDGEQYSIEPITKGYDNINFYEQASFIKDPSGNVVGRAFAVSQIRARNEIDTNTIRENLLKVYEINIE